MNYEKKVFVFSSIHNIVKLSVVTRQDKSSKLRLKLYESY